MSTKKDEGSLHSTRCQSIHWNLLELLTFSKYPLSSSAFVRELEETARCDDRQNLSELRTSYKTKIGTDTMSRVMNYTETTYDESRCKQAVMHYQYYTRQKLTSSLPVHLASQFYFRSHASEITVTIAEIGLGVPLYRGLRGMLRKSGEKNSIGLIE